MRATKPAIASTRSAAWSPSAGGGVGARPGGKLRDEGGDPDRRQIRRLRRAASAGSGSGRLGPAGSRIASRPRAGTAPPPPPAAAVLEAERIDQVERAAHTASASAASRNRRPSASSSSRACSCKAWARTRSRPSFALLVGEQPRLSSARMALLIQPRQSCESRRGSASLPRRTARPRAAPPPPWPARGRVRPGRARPGRAARRRGRAAARRQGSGAARPPRACRGAPGRAA